MLQLHVAGCLSSVFPGDSTLGPEISYPCSVQPSNPFLEGKSCYLLTYAYMAAFTRQDKKTPWSLTLCLQWAESMVDSTRQCAACAQLSKPPIEASCPGQS